MDGVRRIQVQMRDMNTVSHASAVATDQVQMMQPAAGAQRSAGWECCFSSCMGPCMALVADGRTGIRSAGRNIRWVRVRRMASRGPLPSKRSQPQHRPGTCQSGKTGSCSCAAELDGVAVGLPSSRWDPGYAGRPRSPASSRPTSTALPLAPEPKPNVLSSPDPPGRTTARARPAPASRGKAPAAGADPTRSTPTSEP